MLGLGLRLKLFSISKYLLHPQFMREISGLVGRKLDWFLKLAAGIYPTAKLSFYIRLAIFAIGRHGQELPPLHVAIAEIF